MLVRRVLSPLFVLVSVLSVAACGGGDTGQRTCTVGADCASGECLPSGQCAPVGDTVGGDATDVLFPDAGEDTDAADATSEDGTDAVADDTATTDADDATDTTVADTATEDTTVVGCHPNYDRVITRAEAPFGPNLSANYEITTDVTGFDSAATCDGAACAWDLVDVPGTVTEQIDETIAPADTWWEDEPGFEDATFAAVLGEFSVSYFYWDICDQTQLGVYQVTDDAVLLLGIVGEDQVDGTALVYDPPLPILKFPLEVGASWTVDTTATGPLCGSWADYVIDQTLTASVDAAGAVATPYGDFTDVVRVNSVLERHIGIGILPTSVRSHTFVAECFTRVAIVTSAEGADDEEDGEIRDIAEIRSLANLP